MLQLKQIHVRLTFVLLIIVILLRSLSFKLLVLIYFSISLDTFPPGLGVVDVTLLNDTTTNTSTTTPARGTIGGSGITVEGMFRISDNAQVKFSRVYLEGGVGGRGGCIYVQHGNLTLNDVVVRRNKALQGGAIYLEEGGRASLYAT